MKYIFTPELPTKLPEILQLITQISDANTGSKVVEITLNYLSRGTDKISLDTVTEIIDNLPEIGAKYAMPTIAETLDKQGYKRGFTQGVSRGERKNSLRTTLSL